MNTARAIAKNAGFTVCSPGDHLRSQSHEQVLAARADNEQQDHETEQHDFENGRLENQRAQRLEFAHG